MYKTDAKNAQLNDFFKNLAHKPYCADDLLYGLQIRPKKTAINMQYIQGNQPCMIHYFFFDIDRSDAVMAWHDANLPMPYWTAQTQKNGHAHICYKLEIPLCTSDLGSQKAIVYASKVQAGLANKLGADVGYSHLITKNPFHKDWRVTFWSEQAYTLDYLADFIELPKKLNKQQEQSGLGRNCTLFDTVRKWAYTAVRDYMHYDSSHEWEKAVRAQIEAINNGFEQALPYSEVKATAKSIAKWVWQRFSYGNFSEIQAKRGAKGGKAKGHAYTEKREQAVALKAEGLSYTQIAEQLKVARRSVINWCK